MTLNLFWQCMGLALVAGLFFFLGYRKGESRATIVYSGALERLQKAYYAEADKHLARCRAEVRKARLDARKYRVWAIMRNNERYLKTRSMNNQKY